MTTEQKQANETPVKSKGGRPKGFSPTKAAETKGMSISVEGDEVVIRLPKKDLSRKLLADLI